ncbi:hypothetical protein [Scytonema sp. NUACC26]
MKECERRINTGWREFHSTGRSNAGSNVRASVSRHIYHLAIARAD